VTQKIDIDPKFDLDPKLDWCALKEALHKCIDTIQYNTAQVEGNSRWTSPQTKSKALHDSQMRPWNQKLIP